MLSRRLAPPLLVPAAAGLALAFAGGSSAADGAYPVIEKVSAKKVAVGQTLVLTGTGFRKGRNVNIVAFARRGGGRVVFTRARRASATRLSVVVPADLVPVFARKDGVPQPTRFGLRVLAERLGAHFTADDRSPLIAPASAPIARRRATATATRSPIGPRPTATTTCWPTRPSARSAPTPAGRTPTATA